MEERRESAHADVTPYVPADVMCMMMCDGDLGCAGNELDKIQVLIGVDSHAETSLVLQPQQDS